MRRGIVRLALGGLVALASTAYAQQPPYSGASNQVAVAAEPDLAAVRAATERFRDIDVALAEGYVRSFAGHCTTAEMVGKPKELGAMGIHYSRRDLLGITGLPDPRVRGTGTHTDFLEPAILIYEPQKDGSLELVAIENLVFIEAWERAGNQAPPSFRGVAYDRMADEPSTPVDEAHMFEPHYDRHVWLYRENPNGIYAQFNPDVTCEHDERADVSERVSRKRP